jgi:hypothetical protein
MKVCAVAMTEVQDDSVYSEAAAFYDWDAAVDLADKFMMDHVGDFFDIEKENLQGRRNRLDELKRTETQVWNGERRLDMSYRCEGLVVSVNVMEMEMTI